MGPSCSSRQPAAAAPAPEPAGPAGGFGSTTALAAEGEQQEQQQPIGLDALPLDALGAVLRHLPLPDVLRLSHINRAFRETLDDERVWQLLCAREWPQTDARRWVVRPAGRGSPAPLGASPLPPPATFKEAYLLLHEACRLAADGGTWRLLGVGPRSALVQFRFTASALIGYKLDWHSLEDPVDRDEWLSICPARGLCLAVQSVDERMATLLEHSRRPAGIIHRSPSAEAAASVMLGSGRSSPLGTSPQLMQFETELAAFVSPLVQSGSGKKQRRRSAAGTPRVGGSGSGGPDGSPTSHHLERVPLPLRTRQHPLVGMWAAAPMADGGIQVLRLCMDFSGRSARILAWKVTGDQVVPAGRLAFVAQAAALSQPWLPAEHDLIAAAQERLLEEEGGWDEFEAGGGGRGHVAAVHRAWVQEGPLPPAGVPDVSSLAEARLWQYSEDRLGLCWVDSAHVDEMRRIDAELRAP